MEVKLDPTIELLDRLVEAEKRGSGMVLTPEEDGIADDDLMEVAH